jgi:hypothetical protein
MTDRTEMKWQCVALNRATFVTLTISPLVTEEELRFHKVGKGYTLCLASQYLRSEISNWNSSTFPYS